MIKVIYFDFFNVISTPVFTPVIQKFLPENRHSFFFDKLTPLDLGDLSENDLTRQIAEQAAVEITQIEEEIISGPQVDHDLLNYIQGLKPRFKVGILSNAARSMIERILGTDFDIFDITIISSDLKLLKPNLEIYNLAVQKADCEPDEILFFDDVSKNVEAAKVIGMNALIYTDYQNFLKDMSPYVE